jgi:tetratricopeptide (TPR) repeat protein
MTTKPSADGEEQYAALLEHFHDALATGDAATVSDSFNVAPDVRCRLERHAACLRLLDQALARPTPTDPTPPAGRAGDHPLALGRFAIRRELGRGGFGVVFLAFDPQLSREIALKVPRAEVLVTEDFRERFLREARAAAGLDHPNLVAVHEAGTVGAVCYIAYAYCPGTTLAAWLKARTEPVAHRDAALLAATLADAVHAAHQRGVVHRDLKPANVLVAAESGGPLSPAALKITDFGLAKVAASDSAQTNTGAILGTPSYMAPEQAAGHSRAVGPAADVYALGAILYEVITGRPPFQGDAAVDTLYLVRHEEPLPPARLRPGLPRDLQTICLHCLHKDPRKRYGSAAALADDLRRFIQGEPIHARPTPAWERCWMWARRRPAVAALLALSAAALLAFVVSTWLHNAWLQTAQQAAEDRAADAERARADAVRQEGLTRQEYQRAEANLTHALEVLNALTHVGNDQLWDVPHTEAVRRAILEKALAFHKKFLQQQPTQPGLRLQLARAEARVGEICQMLDQRTEAENAYRLALVRLEALAAEFPREPAYRKELAAVWGSLGRLLQAHGLVRDAEDAFRRAVKLQQQLAAGSPGSHDDRLALALSFENLGNLLETTGRSGDAEEALRAALKLRQAVVDQFPKLTDCLESLAVSYHNLALLLDASGRAVKARDAFRQASAINQKLAAAFPKAPAYRHHLADNYASLAGLLGDAGEVQEAERVCRQALELLQGLVDDFPQVGSYRQSLAMGYTRLGTFLTSMGQLAGAEAAQRQALQLMDKLVADFPTVAAYRVHLAVSYANLGHALEVADRLADAGSAFEQAVALRGKLVKEYPTVPRYRKELAKNLHDLGTVYRLAGQRQKALQVLPQALELWTRLAEEFPMVADYQFQLSVCHYHFAQVWRDDGQNDSAEAAFREAIRRAEPLAAGADAIAERRHLLAAYHVDLGFLLARMQRKAEAEAAFRRSLELVEQLAKDFPHVANYTSTLAVAQHNVALALTDQGDLSGAIDLLRQAVANQQAALQHAPNKPAWRQYLWRHFAGLAEVAVRLGLYREAVGAAAALADTAPKSKSWLGDYQAAATLAYCAVLVRNDPRIRADQRSYLAEAYAALAVRYLTMAGTKGFANWQMVRSDPRFRELAAREDFLNLMRTWEAQ